MSYHNESSVVWPARGTTPLPPKRRFPPECRPFLYGRMQITGVFWASAQKDGYDHVTQERTLEAVSCQALLG